MAIAGEIVVLCVAVFVAVRQRSHVAVAATYIRVVAVVDVVAEAIQVAVADAAAAVQAAPEVLEVFVLLRTPLFVSELVIGH